MQVFPYAATELETRTGGNCSFTITVCTLRRELNLINRALSDVLVQQEVEIYDHLHPQLCDLTGPVLSFLPSPPCTAAALQQRPLTTACGSAPTSAETRLKFYKGVYKDPIVLQK